MALALGVAAAPAAAAPGLCIGSDQPITASNAETARTALLCLINNERTERGLPALTRNPALAGSSQAHADDMAARNYVSDTEPNPVVHGRHPRDRATAFGHPTSSALGERIFWSGATPRTNAAAAFADPNLCVPMVDRAYSQAGIGVFVQSAVPVFVYSLGGTGTPTGSNALCPITQLVTPPDPVPVIPVVPPRTPVPTPTVPTPAPVVPVLTPTAAAQALAKQPPAAVAKALGFPSAKVCLSKRAFTIRLREPKPIKLKSAKLSLLGRNSNAKRVGGRLAARVDLRGFKKGTFVVKITAKTTTGVTLKGNRKYKTCASKK